MSWNMLDRGQVILAHELAAQLSQKVCDEDALANHWWCFVAADEFLNDLVLRFIVKEYSDGDVDEHESQSLTKWKINAVLKFIDHGDGAFVERTITRATDDAHLKQRLPPYCVHHNFVIGFDKLEHEWEVVGAFVSEMKRHTYLLLKSYVTAADAKLEHDDDEQYIT